jgi:hypothetical protein
MFGDDCKFAPVKGFGTIQRLAFRPSATPQPVLADPRGPAPPRADQPLWRAPTQEVVCVKAKH